jgi:hypothetical protein
MLGIEWEIQEEMSMFMTFLTVEGDVFIVYGLDPVFILIFYGDRARQSLGNVHIHTDSAYDIYLLCLVASKDFTYHPSVLPIPIRISSSQNSCGRE